MKDIFKFDKKFFKICLYVVVSICAVIIFYEISSDPKTFFGTILSILQGIIKALAPIIYGIVIAYLLYKPCHWMEDKLSKINFFEKRKKLLRAAAVLLVNLIAIGFLILIFYAVIPTTVNSIAQIISRANELVTPLQDFVDRLKENGYVIKLLSFANINMDDISQSGFILDLLSRGQEILQSFGIYLLGFLLNAGTFLYNFILGFITAIYINLELVDLKRQLRNFFSTIMPNSYGKMMHVFNLSNEMFFKYLIGKSICSALVGVVCYICCLIFGIQYAVLISIIVAIFNMIPLFGPFIGAVPAIIFALLSGFNAAIAMAVILVVVQVIDQNILEPKIIGNIVHLNGFWIIVSIIICGKIGGIFGMILAIPIFAVLRLLIGEWLEHRREKLELKNRTSDENKTLPPQ